VFRLRRLVSVDKRAVIETLVAMVSKLADEVAHLKTFNIELIEISDLKGLAVGPRAPSTFLSGHCLLSPTGKL
jgi:hypothetical protein